MNVQITLECVHGRVPFVHRSQRQVQIDLDVDAERHDADARTGQLIKRAVHLFGVLQHFVLYNAGVHARTSIQTRGCFAATRLRTWARRVVAERRRNRRGRVREKKAPAIIPPEAGCTHATWRGGGVGERGGGQCVNDAAVDVFELDCYDINRKRARFNYVVHANEDATTFCDRRVFFSSRVSVVTFFFFFFVSCACVRVENGNRCWCRNTIDACMHAYMYTYMQVYNVYPPTA